MKKDPETFVATETMYREYKAIPAIKAQRDQIAKNFRAMRQMDPAKARKLWLSLKGTRDKNKLKGTS